MRYGDFKAGLSSMIVIAWGILILLNGSAVAGEKSGTTNTLPGTGGWNDRLETMVLRLLRPFPADEQLRIAMGSIQDMDTGERTPLGEILRTDMDDILVRVENVIVQDDGPAVQDPLGKNRNASIVHFKMSGQYHLDQKSLRLNALLQESESGRIISSSRIQIPHADVDRRQMAVTRDGPDNSVGPRGLVLNDYNSLINRLLAFEPETPTASVKVWTDKNVYQVGDPVVIYFLSNRDAYVTLIDVGTSGEMRILFPNTFDGNNHVSAGKTYAIPSPESGFAIRTEGPPGLERIKFIATDNPLTFGKTDPKQAFYFFPRNDSKKVRDLQILVEKFKEQGRAEEYTEIQIGQEGEKSRGHGRERTIRPEPAPTPPKKPIDIIGVPGHGPDQPSEGSEATTGGTDPEREKE
jgi:Domain of unknown function (DUF4384)